jgi:hypothetical protein
MNTGSFMQLGSRIGQFEIAILVSRGTRFDVFVGRYKQFSKSVALKVLHLDYVQDVRLVNRLHQHMVVIDEIDHPNIALTIEVG